MSPIPVLQFSIPFSILSSSCQYNGTHLFTICNPSYAILFIFPGELSYLPKYFLYHCQPIASPSSLIKIFILQPDSKKKKTFRCSVFLSSWVTQKEEELGNDEAVHIILTGSKWLSMIFLSSIDQGIQKKNYTNGTG